MSEGGDESEFLLILEQKPPIFGSGGYGFLSEVFVLKVWRLRLSVTLERLLKTEGVVAYTIAMESM